MWNILSEMPAIGLDEMSGIRLLRRIDTKFVTTVDKLAAFLTAAAPYYYVQELNGSRLADYHTLYFDTPDCRMYSKHQLGHANREKLRIRSYMDSGISFLEVKRKDNHGCTHKSRMALEGFAADDPIAEQFFLDDADVRRCCHPFLSAHLSYDVSALRSQLSNRFQRVTMVNHAKTERLTIDTDLHFRHTRSGAASVLPHVAVLEVKRAGHSPSPALKLLRELRIFPHGMSKYCIGMALLSDEVRVNRMKPKLHSVLKMTQSMDRQTDDDNAKG